MFSKTVLALGALALATGADAHSFLIKVGNGYPRNFEQFDIAGDGYTYRPGAVPGACGQPNTYSSKYPMATASPGATIQLTWPARNHGPDNLPGRTVDIYSNGQVIATLPFCPGAPSGNDPPCTGSFKLNSGSGVQSYIWFWEFNKGEYYNTCFEVNQGGSGSSSGGSTGGNTGGNTGGAQTTRTTAQAATRTTQPATRPTTSQSSGGGGGASSSGGNCASKWGQCGGQGWMFWDVNNYHAFDPDRLNLLRKWVDVQSLKPLLFPMSLNQ
ncbi:hypothetical protein HDV00_010440 [Rhizophlyctis rosea]|nr:hypothetical protein HDV00_010440 [Rhizophlyctis rosea]